MSDGSRLGKCVTLVAGGGGEIGGAICRRLASEGALVAVGDLDSAKADAVAKEITGREGRAIAIRLDVTDLASARQSVDETVASFGKLTSLINVAVAATPDGNAETLDFEQWERALRVNLSGAFIMCKYAVPEMRKAGGGSIINIASQLGHLHIAGRAPYCTSKAALISLTKVLAMDFARDGIRANSISPGFVLTEMSSRRYGSRENATRIQSPKHLLNRPGDVDDVAAGAAYLVSDDAAFVTGADLLIDGGYVTFKGVMGEDGRPTM